ncbi:MAG: helix-turn-helix transcriptional regulator [Clostridia bacterium]|nr:helix-turn-helix transcriptional regulator [Clostridia bacterium]
MEDIKQIISTNITDLRTAKGLTQIELAEKLNYSDKAISKWERGESLPDVTVLKQLADIFDVTLDYLVQPGHDRRKISQLNRSGRVRNHGFITGMSIILVWLVATLVFIILDLTLKNTLAHFLCFVYAVPVSMIVWLILNSIWFNARRNYLIISLLIWTGLASIFLTFLIFKINIWLIFILGIPSQIIICLWSNLKYRKI